MAKQVIIQERLRKAEDNANDEEEGNAFDLLGSFIAPRVGSRRPLTRGCLIVCGMSFPLNIKNINETVQQKLSYSKNTSSE